MITHVIVGDHKYAHEIPHREHRLANYLSDHPRTEKVLWIYPSSKQKNTPNNNNNTNDNSYSITEIAVPIQYRSVKIPNRMLDRPVFKIYFNKKIKSMINELTGDSCILWYYSPIFSFLCKNDNMWDAIVYDCSDNHTTTGWISENNKRAIVSYKERISAMFGLLNEKRILKNTDVIFVSSNNLYKKIEKSTTAPIYLEETGVDIDNFDTEEKFDPIINIDKPRLGFVGKLKKKIDYQLLINIAEENPSWNIVLVGPRNGGNIDNLIKLSNVTWIGPVEPNQVPKVLNSLDIGLMPYKEIEYNKSVFPLKLHEYLASGIPIVGCGLPSTEHLTQRGVYIHTSSCPSNFSDACTEALSWDDNKSARKHIATKADWNSKFGRIYERVLDVSKYKNA